MTNKKKSTYKKSKQTNKFSPRLSYKKLERKSMRIINIHFVLNVKQSLPGVWCSSFTYKKGEIGPGGVFFCHFVLHLPPPPAFPPFSLFRYLNSYSVSSLEVIPIFCNQLLPLQNKTWFSCKKWKLWYLHWEFLLKNVGIRFRMPCLL